MQAKRGPNEICSLLLDDVLNHVCETIKLHTTSNSYRGQNRNCSVIRYLATLAANGRFIKIFQYSPVRETHDGDLGLVQKSSAQNKQGKCSRK